MAWTRTGGANIQNADFTTSVVNSVPVAVGDFIGLVFCFDTAAGATSAVLIDQLGNVYVRQATATQVTDNERLEVWSCIVTVAGTPTYNVKFNPTPGTTTTTQIDIAADSFTGSNAASVIDGTPTAQTQSAPGTGANAVSSGTLGTVQAGSLVYGGVIISSTGAQIPTVGTGFTRGSETTPVVVTSEYKTYASGSTAITFTDATNGGTARYITGGFAMTAAGGGGGGAVVSPYFFVRRTRAGLD